MNADRILLCERFDSEAKLTGDDSRTIEFCVRTDLPIGTLVGVMLSRSYRDSTGDEAIWVGFGEAFTVGPTQDAEINGFVGKCDIDTSDRSGVAWFKMANSQTGLFTTAPVSDVVTVSMTVGGRQRLRAFGKHNCNLAGSQVTITTKPDGTNFINREQQLLIPMRAEFQPRLRN